MKFFHYYFVSILSLLFDYLILTISITLGSENICCWYSEESSEPWRHSYHASWLARIPLNRRPERYPFVWYSINFTSLCFFFNFVTSYLTVSFLVWHYFMSSYLTSSGFILSYSISTLLFFALPSLFSSLLSSFLIYLILSHPIWQFYRHLCQLLRGEERLSKTPTSQTGWMSRWRKYTERTYICMLFSEMCVL